MSPMHYHSYFTRRTRRSKREAEGSRGKKKWDGQAGEIGGRAEKTSVLHSFMSPMHSHSYFTRRTRRSEREAGGSRGKQKWDGQAGEIGGRAEIINCIYFILHERKKERGKWINNGHFIVQTLSLPGVTGFVRKRPSCFSLVCSIHFIVPALVLRCEAALKRLSTIKFTHMTQITLTTYSKHYIIITLSSSHNLQPRTCCYRLLYLWVLKRSYIITIQHYLLIWNA